MDDRFNISHLTASSFKPGGLRAHYEYRDLGIAAATGGRVGAQVIRVGDAAETSPSHTHTLNFQMIYILRGWAVFAYEGVGEVRLEQGSCAYQPTGIVHSEVSRSPDLEILEITLPADFSTAPAAH